MNGEDRDTILDFAGKIGSLTTAIEGLKTTTERIEQKMDKSHESWEANCRRLRQDCGATKAIPDIFQKLKSITQRVEKLEISQRVAQLTRAQLVKIIGTAVTITTGIVGLLKALGIL